MSGLESKEPPDTVTFGTALRRIRQAAGMSLADLARLGHYSKGYLSRIESGERRPTVQLGTHYDKLLGADGALVALVPAAGPAGRCSTSGLAGSVWPFQLPPPPTLFTDRHHELDRLDAILLRIGCDVPTAMISGMGGVGKTALALIWAHRSARHFPGGVLFADLNGFSSAGAPASAQDVQTSFLHALGIPARLIPESAAQATGLYRSVLRDRRILLVLDNAADARQVRPLLPGAPSVVVLVTSRSRMTGLCARDGAALVPLEPLRPEDSRTLAAAILSGASEETLRQLTEVCGHLPLALRLAAHRLAARGPATMAAGTPCIADRCAWLNLLRSPGDPESDVRTVLQWSYDALPSATQHAVRLFAIYAGAEVTGPAAAVLMDTDLSTSERVLADLADGHLLSETAPGRFRFHDLFRLFAAERASAEPDALKRLGDWYVRQTRAAAAIIAPHMTRLPWHPNGQRTEADAGAAAAGTANPAPGPVLADAESALAFIDLERHNLLTVVEMCAAHGFGEIAWLIADAARCYYYQTRYLRDWAQATETGLRMGRLHADEAAIAAMLASRALYSWAVGDFQRAAEVNIEALQHATRDKWTEGIAMITSNLGMSYYNKGEPERAREAYAKSLTTNRAIGNRHGEAIQLGNLAGVHHEMGEATEALSGYSEALAIYSAAGALDSVALMLVNQANVYMTLGLPTDALARAGKALEICSRRGSRFGTCLAELARARALLACGHVDAGLGSARRAHAEAQAIGDRRIEVDALNALSEVAAAAGNHADAGKFAAAAYNIATAIAYSLGIRDARRALRALESVTAATLGEPEGLLTAAWSSFAG